MLEVSGGQPSLERHRWEGFNQRSLRRWPFGPEEISRISSSFYHRLFYLWTSIYEAVLVSPVPGASDVKFLVKVYSKSWVEFQVVDEREYERLVSDAERNGYGLKLVSSPDQDLPLAVLTT